MRATDVAPVTGIDSRTTAIARVVQARENRRLLMREYAGMAPPGQVLALMVRVMRSLERAGSPPEQLLVTAEAVGRRMLAERLAGGAPRRA